MTDDANPCELDLDGLYERYLVTCRMSGVQPVSIDQAREQIREWNQTWPSGSPSARALAIERLIVPT